MNETFARLLLIGLPTLLLLAGATVWLVVGRALRPVEQIRRAVTDITDIAADLTRRVPEPGTDDEIGRLAETMNAMLARLEDAAARQRRFVADASHELRSPLDRDPHQPGSRPGTPGAGAVAGDRRARGQAGRATGGADQRTASAGALGRRQGRGAAPHVPLAPLLTSSKTTPRRAERAASCSMSRPDLAVTGEPADLARLFRNLLDNAAALRTHVGPRLRPRRRRVGARVEIADDGPGIPAEERHRVFDRFVRLDPSRTPGAGSTGLGLAIAKAIVLAHEGTIAVDTAPEGGALVVITLRAFPMPPSGADPTL